MLAPSQWDKPPWLGWHRWGELSLLVLAADTIIATLAWVLVGLVLN
jgi:hypothetical protein